MSSHIAIAISTRPNSVDIAVGEVADDGSAVLVLDEKSFVGDERTLCAGVHAYAHALYAQYPDARLVSGLPAIDIGALSERMTRYKLDHENCRGLRYHKDTYIRVFDISGMRAAVDLIDGGAAAFARRRAELDLSSDTLADYTALWSVLAAAGVVA